MKRLSCSTEISFDDSPPAFTETPSAGHVRFTPVPRWRPSNAPASRKIRKPQYPIVIQIVYALNICLGTLIVNAAAQGMDASGECVFTPSIPCERRLAVLS
ncbi:MAG: hypothetical protein ACKV2V_15220 [Blastocatellia bacterium]